MKEIGKKQNFAWLPPNFTLLLPCSLQGMPLPVQKSEGQVRPGDLHPESLAGRTPRGGEWFMESQHSAAVLVMGMLLCYIRNKPGGKEVQRERREARKGRKVQQSEI